MAFEPNNLNVTVQTVGGVGMRFVFYRTDDDVTTVTGEGYFASGKKCGLRLYDLIFVSPITTGFDPYALNVTAVDGDGDVTASISNEDMRKGIYDPAGKAEQVLTVGDIIDEDDFASNSDTKVPTQQSVKAFASDPANHWHKVPNAAAYLRKTSDRIDHDGRWSLFDFIDPARHSDIRDGASTYDADNDFHSAFDSGERLFLPRGTFLVSGLTGVADLNMRGADWKSIIKLADGSNATILSFTDKSNVELSRIKFDGNKAGQTTTVNHRGVYFLASAAHVAHVNLSQIYTINTGGQGIMFSAPDPTNYRAGRYSSIMHCRVDSPGHTAYNGGTSEIAATTYWANNFAYLPTNQGFKTSGNHYACKVEGNYANTGEGEGFETEYVSGAPEGIITYHACQVKGAGGGWRLNGTNSVIRVTDCYGEEIETSVVTAFGNINELHINGLTGKNFGKSASRGATTGLDLVSLIDVSSATPTKAYLSNLVGKDDQGSPTGEYLVYVQDGFKEYWIGGNNDATSLKEGAFYFGTQGTAQRRITGSTRGWSCEHQDEASTATNGTAGTHDLKTHTIKRYEARLGTTIDFQTRVSFSGTNGAKEIQFQLNAETVVSLATWLAAETDTLVVRGKIWFPSDTVVLVQFDMITKGTTVATAIHRAYSISSGTDLAIKFIAVMSGTDTATQAYLKLRAID